MPWHSRGPVTKGGPQGFRWPCSVQLRLGMDLDTYYTHSKHEVRAGRPCNTLRKAALRRPAIA